MSEERPTTAGRSELGVALGLAAVAVIIAIDTLNQRHLQVNVGVLGPRVIPTLVAVGLAVCAVAIGVQVLRGGQPPVEEAEDVDASAPMSWTRVAILAGSLVLTAYMIPLLGFVPASALLLIGAAYTLGSRSRVLLPVGAVVLALAVYYGFALGLGIELPAGLLDGIL